MVEIAKALARDPKILILDEATSALTAADVDEGLRDAASSCAPKAWRSSTSRTACTRSPNSPTTARSIATASYVETFAAGTKIDDAIVEMMIGREYDSVFPPQAGEEPQTARRSSRCATSPGPGELNGIDLDIRPGEIVGLGGLDGQGQRQLLLGLFGTLIGATGTVEIDGKPVKLRSPKRAKSAMIGMALIPEDRKNEGLMLPMSVRENLSFAAVEQLQPLRRRRPQGGGGRHRRDGRSF